MTIKRILHDHISKGHEVAVEFDEQTVEFGHPGGIACCMFISPLGNRPSNARNSTPEKHRNITVSTYGAGGILQSPFTNHIMTLCQSNHYNLSAVQERELLITKDAVLATRISSQHANWLT